MQSRELIARGRKTCARLRERAAQSFIAGQQRERVERILSADQQPEWCDSEDVFATVSAEYPPLENDGWSSYNAWWRGIQRAPALIQISGLRRPGARALDASCGDGMTGTLLASYGHQVTLHDLEDWRDPRARPLPFTLGDLCQGLPMESESFDLVFSYNTFEHLTDPAQALAELLRLTKKGGVLYLDFGPLYNSPWGLHAFGAMRMPYPQFLFSPAFREAKFRDFGLYDLGRETDTLQPLNGWRAEQYERLWCETGCEILSQTAKRDTSHLDLIERFPQSFQGQGLTFDDVTVTQLDVALRRIR